MTDQFDPYRVLDVPRDADAEAVKAAFRTRSKTTHPDVGGHVEAFLAVRRAYQILSSPERRARYDETGESDDAPTLDFHGQVTALQVNLFETLIQGGQAFRRDIDVIKAMQAGMRATLSQVSKQHGRAVKVRSHLRDLRDRIKRDAGDNLFVHIIDKKLADIERDIGAMDMNIRVVEAAQAELDCYTCVTDIARHVTAFHQFAPGWPDASTSTFTATA